MNCDSNMVPEALCFWICYSLSEDIFLGIVCSSLLPQNSMQGFIILYWFHLRYWDVHYILNGFVHVLKGARLYNWRFLITIRGESNLTFLSVTFLKLNNVCDGRWGRRGAATAAEGAGEPLEESRRFPVLSLYSPGVAVRRWGGAWWGLLTFTSLYILQRVVCRDRT